MTSGGHGIILTRGEITLRHGQALRRRSHALTGGFGTGGQRHENVNGVDLRSGGEAMFQSLGMWFFTAPIAIIAESVERSTLGLCRGWQAVSLGRRADAGQGGAEAAATPQLHGRP